MAPPHPFYFRDIIAVGNVNVLPVQWRCMIVIVCFVWLVVVSPFVPCGAYRRRLVRVFYHGHF